MNAPQQDRTPSKLGSRWASAFPLAGVLEPVRLLDAVGEGVWVRVLVFDTVPVLVGVGVGTGDALGERVAVDVVVGDGVDRRAVAVGDSVEE